MRPIAAALLGLTLGVACVSFDLDSRRFRCDGLEAACDDGWTCGADGYCVEVAPIDAASSDGATVDSMIVLGEICTNNQDDDGDGDVDCADSECPGDTMCGAGCMCDGDGPFETLCMDTLDNDTDGDVDCRDSDCPACVTGMCCPDGECRPVC